MTVQELIARLSEMPQTAKVGYIYDGALRAYVEHVWLAQSGWVALADSEDVVYHTCDRPADAPTEEQDLYWTTPGAPDRADGQ